MNLIKRTNSESSVKVIKSLSLIGIPKAISKDENGNYELRAGYTQVRPVGLPLDMGHDAIPGAIIPQARIVIPRVKGANAFYIDHSTTVISGENRCSTFIQPLYIS